MKVIREPADLLWSNIQLVMFHAKYETGTEFLLTFNSEDIPQLKFTIYNCVKVVLLEIVIDTRFQRYLAPEVLDESICNWRQMRCGHAQFLYFRRADMYSLALVMWEVAMRTQCDSGSLDFGL